MTIPSASEHANQLEYSNTVDGNENITAIQEVSLQFLTKLNKHLPYDLTISHLSVYSRDIKTYVHTKTCALNFIAVVFIITKTQETHYPSMDKNK